MSLDTIAGKQFGVISVAQLRTLKFTRAKLRTEIAHQRLIPWWGNTFRVAGVPDQWEQKAIAATLSIKSSVLSHQTAGQIWRLAGVVTGPKIHVLTHRRTTLALDHQHFALHLTKFAFNHARHRGLPVTPLARTLLDLAEHLDDAALETALDSAQHGNPYLEQDLDRELAAVNPKYAPGAGRLKSLLDVRGGVATESPLETRTRRALRATTLPAPKLQHDLFDQTGRFLIRLDFAWPQHRVALHCDGFTWHRRRKQFELDARQRSAMAALDWHSLVVTDRSFDAQGWLRDLTTVLARRAPQLRLL